jgi:hypothetical protein
MKVGIFTAYMKVKADFVGIGHHNPHDQHALHNMLVRTIIEM